MDPDCHYGDHTWNGTSQCVRCDARLRCWCGVYVREDNMDDHIQRCPHFERMIRVEVRRPTPGDLRDIEMMRPTATATFTGLPDQTIPPGGAPVQFE